MTYMLSKARREFETQIRLNRAEVERLHAQARAMGLSGSRLLGAYYVFAFAQLEVYVRTIVDDTIQTISSAALKPSSLPDLMVGYVLHKGDKLGDEYRKFSNAEDEGPLLERVAATAKRVVAWEAGGPPIGLNSANFLEKKKYPSPRNLPQLFRRLGIRQLWPVVNSTGRFDGEKSLTSLNDLRTAIAHDGAVPAGFGIQDFRERLEQMKHFVGIVDRCVASHFCPGHISRPAWNKAMT